MSEPILSQEEINALMAALQSEMEEGDDDSSRMVSGGSRVHVYDFLRPGKLSKDQIRTLEMMHESFGRNMQTSLSAYLRTQVNIELASVKEMMYADVAESLAPPVIPHILRLQPLPGSAILYIDSNIGFVMLDRLLGGPGTALKRPRPLTEIEQTVFRRIIERMVQILEEEWNQVADLEAQFERIEQNPQFTQLVPPKDMTVVIRFNVKLCSVLGRMSLCIPYSALEPVSSKLKAQLWFAGEQHKPDPLERETIKRRLESMRLPLIVELGTGRITIGDFLDLGVGDVVQLDTRVRDPLAIRIGRGVKFLGTPGRVGSRLAVELISTVKKEADFLE